MSWDDAYRIASFGIEQERVKWCLHEWIYLPVEDAYLCAGCSQVISPEAVRLVR